ncbi:SDR family NAD(P)-dependent oxidoreductase [Streptococcus halichoeri]|uniref:SDR family NAD(P)-dependent oxidoreductase n=1 Tax=Streptococcus halichoeri TaxID=254785 RepID=UPI0013587899|nr:SDR family oxidoreductase [Streptococcus halichoeri]
MAKRTFLITGASGGLAQAIIHQLSTDDFIILVGRDAQKLATLYADIPHKAIYAIDIKDSQAIALLVEEIAQKHGQVDVLINNAGFGAFKSYDAFDSAEIAEMFAVNTLASITFARLIGHQMASRGRGHIINIVSMAGLIASSKSTVYSATKFAMIGYSNALRLELADQGVFVTTVNPGPIATGFFDQADPSGQYLASVSRFTLQPQQVAKRIVAVLDRPKRELNLPFLLAAANTFYALFPRLSDFFARKVFNYK